jgi:ArsR family transcriptional regulator, arsenate/arsenite/antimonite-responsive transcriptional repressor
VIEDCCSPEGTLELSPREAEDLAGMFKALADPVRLRLLSMIAGSENETCACDLTSPVARSQPTVSHHLSVLVNAGLVKREQRGKWAWFQLAPERAAFIRTMLQDQVRPEIVTAHL